MRELWSQIEALDNRDHRRRCSTPCCYETQPAAAAPDLLAARSTARTLSIDAAVGELRGSGSQSHRASRRGAGRANGAAATERCSPVMPVPGCRKHWPSAWRCSTPEQCPGPGRTGAAPARRAVDRCGAGLLRPGRTSRAGLDPRPGERCRSTATGRPWPGRACATALYQSQRLLTHKVLAQSGRGSPRRASKPGSRPMPRAWRNGNACWLICAVRVSRFCDPLGRRSKRCARLTG